jgi:hypothetical protein
MTPDRWQQIERVYLAALERDAKKRLVFLDEACGEDAALREEVESLLSHEPDAAEFLESSGPNLRVSDRQSVLPAALGYLLSTRFLQVAVAVPVAFLVFSVVKNRHQTVADLISRDAAYLYWIAAAALILKFRNRIRIWLERSFFS